jgi:hypothetical protein
MLKWFYYAYDLDAILKEKSMAMLRCILMIACRST